MSKQSKTLIKLIVLGVLTVFATIPVIAFGWFSNNNGISASGTGVTVKSLGLEIRSERNGADISVLEPSEEMKHIKNVIYDDEDKIRPSSSGISSFTFITQTRMNTASFLTRRLKTTSLR